MSRVLVPLVLLLAAGGVVLVRRAVFDDGTPEATDAPVEGAVVESRTIRLAGTASLEPDARLEAWFRDLKGEHLAGEAWVRLKDEIRRMVAADPRILERLAALARMSVADLKAMGLTLGDVLSVLTLLGPDGAKVLAEVGVSETDFRVQVDVLLSLESMGAEAVAATPILLAALRATSQSGNSPPGNVFLVRIFGAIGPGALEAVPFLQGVLGPPVDDGIAWAAAHALVQITGATEATLATLRAALLDEETTSRAGVIGALAALGPDGAALAPDLLPLLDDVEGGVRRAAAWALGCMGVSSPEVVSALLAQLELEHDQGAGAALGALGAEGAEALEHLARTGDEVSDRMAGLQGLLGAKADLRPLEGVILGILESDHPDAWRDQALAVFARMAPPPEGDDVLDALVRTLDVEPLALGAARALANMARPEATERLLAWVARRGGIRPGLVAADALWGAGKDVPGTTDLVVEALRKAEDPSLRSWAWSLLAREQAHPRPQDLLPLYDRCVGNEATRAPTWQPALSALLALDGAEDEVFARLLAALDGQRAVRAVAAAALIERPRRANESVPALVDAFVRAADAETYLPGEFLAALDVLGPKWPGTREAIDARLADASPKARRDLEVVRGRLFQD